MKKTPNLNLPVYDTPNVDTFKVEDWNNANETLDEIFGELKNNPNVNAIDITARQDIINNHRSVTSQLESIIQDTNNKFSGVETKKLDKNGIVTMANMGQDVKQAMTGGSVAVVGNNTVLEDNIVNKQITSIKTDFLANSGNLFNKNKITLGAYINGTGTISNDIGYNCTDFINVEGSTQYRRSKRGVGAWYDVNKVFITAIDRAEIITSPPNACYLRYTLYASDDVNVEMCVKGNELGKYVSHFNKLFNPYELLQNDIQGTFLKFYYNEIGDIRLIQHIDKKNSFVIREDSFVYSSTGVIEERTLKSTNDKITYSYKFNGEVEVI